MEWAARGGGGVIVAGGVRVDAALGAVVWLTPLVLAHRLDSVTSKIFSNPIDSCDSAKHSLAGEREWIQGGFPTAVLQEHTFITGLAPCGAGEGWAAARWERGQPRLGTCGAGSAAAAPGSQRPCARHLRELRGEPRRDRLCSAFFALSHLWFRVTPKQPWVVPVLLFGACVIKC